MIKRPPNAIIGPSANPYMLRWYLWPKLKNLPRLYLHKICRSDDDRALHDHPWWFVGLLLKGSYTEEYEALDGSYQTRRRTAPSIAFRPISTRHRVILDGEFTDDEYRVQPAWTIILTGRDVRGWGFWCRKRLVEMSGRHREAEWFVPSNRFEGCGE